MLRLAILFFVVALLVVLLDLAGAALGAMWFAQILFLAFALLFVLSLVGGAWHRPSRHWW